MSDWQLGIDFGTSFTVVAVARGDRVEVIDVESDGRARLPSAVFLTEDGEILVGSKAQHQAVFAPERFEPTPKRCIGEGELFLGDGLVQVSDLVAGVFRRVYKETCRQQGETPPSAVLITHPAEWADARLQVLRTAVAAAGIERARFIPEPVAAAARIALTTTKVGQRIAVYDFGGGTFDAAVLLRTPTGFEVAGPPTGRDPLGGEDIDRRIIDHVGELLADEYPDEWKKLMNPPDVGWRRSAANLRTEVQQVKETLSEVNSSQLFVAGIGRGVQLTRTELEDLIRADVEETVATLEEAIAAAGTTAAELAGIFLVGGSSRIPLVADTIWRRLQIAPTAQDNPKSVVALGAAAWVDTTKDPPPDPPIEDPPIENQNLERTTDRAGVDPNGEVFPPVGPTPPLRGPLGPTPPLRGPLGPSPEREPAPLLDQDRMGEVSPSGASFRTRLAMAIVRGGSPSDSQCGATVILEQPGADRVTVQGWPAPHGVTNAALAHQLGIQHASSTPGFREMSIGPAKAFGWNGLERRFSTNGAHGQELRVERYLVVGGQSLAATVTADSAAALDGITLQAPQLPPSDYFALALLFEFPAAGAVRERVQLRRPAAGEQVSADHFVRPPGYTAASWLESQVNTLVSSTASAVVLDRRRGMVIDGAAGDVVTVRVGGRRPMLATIGVAEVDGELYEVTIWLAEKDKGRLSWLAGCPRVQRLPSRTDLSQR